jgi:hypothetical protein
MWRIDFNFYLNKGEIGLMKMHIQKLSESRDNPEMSRRILMETYDTIFDQGMANILSQRTELEVWGIRDANAFILAKAAAEICPDVILLFYTDPEKQKRLIALLNSFPILQRLRVIILHLDSYTLYAYIQKHWIQLRGETFYQVLNNNKLSTLDVNNSNLSRLPQEFKEKLTGKLQSNLEI